jgi:hypothetical protein
VPRNHVADDVGTRPLRWCPVHQVAFTHTTYEGWHWHPLPEDRLRYALRWVAAGQCTVRGEIVPCGRCGHQEDLIG